MNLSAIFIPALRMSQASPVLAPSQARARCWRLRPPGEIKQVRIAAPPSWSPARIHRAGGGGQGGRPRHRIDRFQVDGGNARLEAGHFALVMIAGLVPPKARLSTKDSRQ